jgi:hypothetical protein
MFVHLSTLSQLFPCLCYEFICFTNQDGINELVQFGFNVSDTVGTHFHICFISSIAIFAFF